MRDFRYSARTPTQHGICLVATAAVLELAPMASSHASTSCLCTECDGLGRVALLLIVEAIAGGASAETLARRVGSRSRLPSISIALRLVATYSAMRVLRGAKPACGAGSRVGARREATKIDRAAVDNRDAIGDGRHDHCRQPGHPVALSARAGNPRRARWYVRAESPRSRFPS